MKKINFLEKKETTAVFGIIAFISGILFINKEISGNIVQTNYYPLNLLGLIGLLLIICSIILGLYSIRKK